MKNRPRSYDATARKAKAGAAEIRMLQAARELVRERGHEALTFAAIAERTGVNQRTLFRRFKTRDGLLSAFWRWANQDAGITAWPQSREQALDFIEHLFAYFDGDERLIRSGIHSAEGRKMLALVAEARRASALAIASSTSDRLSEDDRLALAAAASILQSPQAWEILRDLWGLSDKRLYRVSRRMLELSLQGTGRPRPPRIGRAK